MRSSREERIEKAIGQRVTRLSPLTGGCIGEVYRADLENGERVVVKVSDDAEGSLGTEGAMLRYLAEQSALPVPAVYHAEPGLLVMTFIEGDSQFDAAAQRHAAELLAALHSIRADQFGFHQDTLIGGLRQVNPWTDSWLEFFGQHRLVFMAEEACAVGRLRPDVRDRVKRFADNLDDFLLEPEHPSLLHGDVWTTNVLARGGRITGFLDPAIYYGHPEIELAFTTLFGTFGRPFFERYAALRGIDQDFFPVRKDIYNLYPLLVHTRLFGGGYASSVSQILAGHDY